MAAGTTYWYSDVDPLYPFGHGLSWSSVAYESVSLSTSELTAATATAPEDLAAAVTATVRVRNTGRRPVDELVALYALARDLPVRAPRRRLVAHTRVRLEPGEAASVSLAVDTSRLAVWDVGVAPDGPGTSTPGAFHLQPGDYEIGAAPRAPTSRSARPCGSRAPRAARPLAGRTLLAHGFSAYDGVVTSDRSADAGSALEVAVGRTSGWARFDGLLLDGVQCVTLSVAAAAGSRAGVAAGALAVSLWVPSSSSSAPPVRRLPRGSRSVGSTSAPRAATGGGTSRSTSGRRVRGRGRHLCCRCGRRPSRAVDLQVRLEGAARLAEMRS
ncbi:fibronectin type III-like domain-contianing protein [Oerskovia sp. M15]